MTLCTIKANTLRVLPTFSAAHSSLTREDGKPKLDVQTTAMSPGR